MKKIDKLIKDYDGYVFSSGGSTGTDYKSFQTKYKNILKEIASNIGGELVSFNKNHYEFSAFVEKSGKFAYISISDVRHFSNEWSNRILVRTAKDKKDFSGGMNQYAKLRELEDKLEKVLS